MGWTGRSLCSRQNIKAGGSVYTNIMYVLGLPRAPAGLSFWDPPGLGGPSLKIHLQGWV